MPELPCVITWTYSPPPPTRECCDCSTTLAMSRKPAKMIVPDLSGRVIPIRARLSTMGLSALPGRPWLCIGLES